ncbi:CsgE family curli-type amyloid fiber assembly protein [Tunicatimonas pelagia]|uniref:CsgE family curli-type amyloid fiber assembly protein n=1 Tax=Tunicatimonas pelagia TaxID=931531 RepID=UPI002664EF15|nr:CsgE family curli-type amyloid fiber assembly protein [Tunicatimonas pelagia]WKN42130.1 CsgE family curli-type amyloid fiber assembly protein [Tunicatimonas pelagia]
MTSQAVAQQARPDDIGQDGSEGVEINGLVVDETVTKVGRDFYELFYQQWNAPISTINYSLFIRERPMNGLGSQIAIYINETEIFAQAVQPRHEVVESLAHYAVSLANQYVQNYESIVQQLGNQDQQGSGIF